jgi:hypothetical protein
LVRLEVDCRILGRQPAEVIAEMMEVPLTLVDAYKTYFFDVGDRIDAAACIAHHIIGMAPCGAAAPETWMKLFVYQHGPAAIEPWLDYLRHQHETHDLKTFEGWQRDAIDIFLRAQELSYAAEDAERLLKCFPIVMGNWKQARVFRSVSSVLHEKAEETLSRLNWPKPAPEAAAEVLRPAKRPSKARGGCPNIVLNSKAG